jgi:hypothetical protein
MTTFTLHGYTIANGVLLETPNPYKLRAWVQDQMLKCLRDNERTPVTYLERFNAALKESEFSDMTASYWSVEAEGPAEEHDENLIIVLDSEASHRYNTSIN